MDKELEIITLGDKEYYILKNTFLVHTGTKTSPLSLSIIFILLTG